MSALRRRPELLLQHFCRNKERPPASRGAPIQRYSADTLALHARHQDGVDNVNDAIGGLDVCFEHLGLVDHHVLAHEGDRH